MPVLLLYTRTYEYIQFWLCQLSLVTYSHGWGLLRLWEVLAHTPFPHPSQFTLKSACSCGAIYFCRTMQVAGTVHNIELMPYHSRSFNSLQKWVTIWWKASTSSPASPTNLDGKRTNSRLPACAYTSSSTSLLSKTRQFQLSVILIMKQTSHSSHLARFLRVRQGERATQRGCWNSKTQIHAEVLQLHALLNYISLRLFKEWDFMRKSRTFTYYRAHNSFIL